MKKQKRVKISPLMKVITELRGKLEASENRADLLKRELDGQHRITDDQSARLNVLNRENDQRSRDNKALANERDCIVDLVKRFTSVSITSLDAVVSHQTTGESTPGILRTR